jgi:Transglycosylase SLT domain.
MKKGNLNEGFMSAEEIIARMEAKRRKRILSRRITTLGMSLMIGISLTAINVRGEGNKFHALEEPKTQTVEVAKNLSVTAQPIEQVVETVKEVKQEAPKTTPADDGIYNSKIDMPKAHQEYLYKLCQERGLNYRKMLAIIKHESQFDVNCITDRDYGYFQVNKSNHAELAKTLKTSNTPLDPYVNLNWGTYMMSNIYKYWSKNGHEGRDLDQLAWSEYNEGHNGLQKWGLATKYIAKVDSEKSFVDGIFN